MLLELSNDEALVLLELISRIEEQGLKPWSEPGEQQVVWRIEAQLEKVLVEPLQENYRELVKQARHRVSQGQV